VPSGASYNFLFFSKALESSRSNAARVKPTNGESSSALPMLVAWLQSTPLVPVFGESNWLAMPTPMIDPIRV
jgi:hypothetical protein